MTKLEALQGAEYFCGPRDPAVKPEHPGAFMVKDTIDPEGYAIVGDNLEELVEEAFTHTLENN